MLVKRKEGLLNHILSFMLVAQQSNHHAMNCPVMPQKDRFECRSIAPTQPD